MFAVVRTNSEHRRTILTIVVFAVVRGCSRFMRTLAEGRVFACVRLCSPQEVGMSCIGTRNDNAHSSLLEWLAGFTAITLLAGQPEIPMIVGPTQEGRMDVIDHQRSRRFTVNAAVAIPCYKHGLELAGAKHARHSHCFAPIPVLVHPESRRTRRLLARHFASHLNSSTRKQPRGVSRGHSCRHKGGYNLSRRCHDGRTNDSSAAI